MKNKLELLGVIDLDGATFTIGTPGHITDEEADPARYHQFEKDSSFGTSPMSNQVKHESGNSGRAVIINTGLDGTFPVYGRFHKGYLDEVVIKVGCTTHEEIKVAQKKLKKLSKRKTNPWGWEASMKTDHEGMEAAIKKIKLLNKKLKKIIDQKKKK